MVRKAINLNIPTDELSKKSNKSKQVESTAKENQLLSPREKLETNEPLEIEGIYIFDINIKDILEIAKEIEAENSANFVSIKKWIPLWEDTCLQVICAFFKVKGEKYSLLSTIFNIRIKKRSVL